MADNKINTENHKDKLGKLLEHGDIVVAPFGKRDLRIQRVVSFGKKMVTLESTTKGKYSREFPRSIKYPEDILKVNEKEYMHWYLTNTP